MMTQEDIEKSKGEEKLSEKNSPLIQKLQQENKLNITTTEPDYIPVRGTWHTQNPTEDFDLDEHVDKFLQGKEKVLLILGDSGAGKSVYCQQLIQRLWKNYDAKEKPLPLFISLPSLKDPVHHAIEEALQSYGLKAEEITALKQNQKFIFILDAYDEIRQDKNLYVTNKLKDWSAKIIITCRSQYLYTMDHYVKYFMPYQGEQRQGWLFSEVVIKPFNQEQIDQYLQQYVAHHKTEWSDWQEYKKYIDEIPGLRKLIETPFLLKLAVEALPQVVTMYQRDTVMPARMPAFRAQGSDTSKQEETSISLSTGSLLPSRDDKTALTRAKLYDVFVDQWFERQEKKIKDHHYQIKVEENIKTNLWAYAKALAREMQQQHVTQVAYEPESDLFGESKIESPWKKFFDDKDPQISLLRDCCLLQQIGKNQYAFFHASLIEYFVTRELYEETLSAKQIFAKREKLEIKESKQEEDEPIIQTTNITSKTLTYQQAYLNQRLFTKEPLILQFLADRVEDDESFKQQLFTIIDSSKQEENITIAAANAITVLNWARISFSGMNLSHVKIPGADLSQGIFDHTNFIYADLSAVNFTQAWLREANLSYTQMQGVEFNEQPYIKCKAGITAIAYSLNGDYVAIARKKKIEVWNVQRKKKFRTLQGHSNRIRALAWDNEGERLASGSDDQTIGIWELERGKKLHTLKGHTDSIVSVAWNSQGNRLASGSGDKTIRIWDIASGKEILKRSLNRIISLSWDSKGKRLALKSYDYMAVWEVDNGKTWWEIDEKIVGSRQAQAFLKISEKNKEEFCIAWDGEGKRIASGSKNNIISIRDAESGKELLTLQGHTGGIKSIAWNSTGKYLASGSYDKTVRIWDVERCKEFCSLVGHTSAATSISWSKDEKHLYTGSTDKTMRVWKIENRKEFHMVGHTKAVMNIAWGKDGKQLASGSEDDTVKLWEVDSGKEISTLRKSYTTCVAWDSEGKRLALGSLDNSVKICEANGGKKILTLEGHEESITCIAWDSKGERLASGSEDCTIRIWETRSGKLLGIFIGHTKEITCVAWDHEGKWIASGSEDETVRIWEVETKQLCNTLSESGGFEGPKNLAFNPRHSNMLAVVTDAYPFIWFWQTGDKKKLHTIETFMGDTQSIAWDQEGNRLAVGGRSDLWIWDVAKTRCLAVLGGYIQAIESVAFYGNDQLATGSADGAVKIWKRISISAQSELWQLQWSTHVSFNCENIEVKAAQGLTKDQSQLLQQRGAKKEQGFIKRQYEKLEKIILKPDPLTETLFFGFTDMYAARLKESDKKQIKKEKVKNPATTKSKLLSFRFWQNHATEDSSTQATIDRTATGLPEDFYPASAWFGKLVTHCVGKLRVKKEVVEIPMAVLTAAVGNVIHIYGNFAEDIVKLLSQTIDPLFESGEYETKIYKTLKLGAIKENNPSIEKMADSLFFIRSLFDKHNLTKYFTEEINKFGKPTQEENLAGFSELLSKVTAEHIATVLKMIHEFNNVQPLKEISSAYHK